jgi:hypothetical protein
MHSIGKNMFSHLVYKESSTPLESQTVGRPSNQEGDLSHII